MRYQGALKRTNSLRSMNTQLKSSMDTCLYAPNYLKHIDSSLVMAIRFNNCYFEAYMQPDHYQAVKAHSSMELTLLNSLVTFDPQFIGFQGYKCWGQYPSQYHFFMHIGLTSPYQAHSNQACQYRSYMTPYQLYQESMYYPGYQSQQVNKHQLNQHLCYGV